MKARKKSDFKMAIREEAKRKIRGPKYTPKGAAAFRNTIESGRQQLLQKGAFEGDSNAKRAKNELHYLLNNYTPKYESRIAQLIDVWRRSGDPEYDPGIRVKLRQARSEYERSNNPF